MELIGLGCWIVVCPILGYILGTQKGRGGSGLLLGLLGPLGVLIVLALPDATRVRCPSCAELVRLDASVCAHCKTKLVPQPLPPNTIGWLGWVTIALLGLVVIGCCLFGGSSPS